MVARVDCVELQDTLNAKVSEYRNTSASVTGLQVKTDQPLFPTYHDLWRR